MPVWNIYILFCENLCMYVCVHVFLSTWRVHASLESLHGVLCECMYVGFMYIRLYACMCVSSPQVQGQLFNA
jgi:hypothetical protein